MDNSTSTDVWNQVKSLVNRIGALQSPDGSVPVQAEENAKALLVELRPLILKLPGQSGPSDYFEAVVADIDLWVLSKLKVPNFYNSLIAFDPLAGHADGLVNYAVFPMIKINGPGGLGLEALKFSAFRPAWLESAILETGNAKCMSASLLDSTEGYSTDSAVFFPETVSIDKGHRDPNHFRIFFSNKEALRLIDQLHRTGNLIRLNLPSSFAECLDNTISMQSVFALWDILHDTAHFKGPLPYDLFFSKRRQPYFAYGFEELRVDVTSYRELHTTHGQLPYAENARYAILYDRLFRFTIAGDRNRNFDALAGQYLFSRFMAEGAINFTDYTFTMDYVAVDRIMEDIADEIALILHKGLSVTRVQHWQNIHAFLARFTSTDATSRWSRGEIVTEAEALNGTNADEFPLPIFLASLRRHQNMKS